MKVGVLVNLVEISVLECTLNSIKWFLGNVSLYADQAPQPLTLFRPNNITYVFMVTIWEREVILKKIENQP